MGAYLELEDLLHGFLRLFVFGANLHLVQTGRQLEITREGRDER